MIKEQNAIPRGNGIESIIIVSSFTNRNLSKEERYKGTEEDVFPLWAMGKVKFVLRKTSSLTCNFMFFLKIHDAS
jgi:hypothetical protein